MDLEDLEPTKKAAKPRDLDSLGVEELEAYIDDLKAEIARVEEKLTAKKAYLSGADSLFKS